MPRQGDSSQQPLLGHSSQGQQYGTGSNKTSGDDLEHSKTVVNFSPGDPEDPRNWPRWKKWLLIGPIVLIDLSVSWGASGFSPASGKFADDFGLPSGLGALGLSAYVLGLAFGPMTLAPLSEVSSLRSPFGLHSGADDVPSIMVEALYIYTPISCTCVCSLHQL